MDDETLLRTMKNGLMIAGHEMGHVGDHWPAIQSITVGLEDEFEEAWRNEAVIGEVEFHAAELIRQFEDSAKNMSPEGRAIIMACAKELWDEYYAAFEPPAPPCEPDPDDLVEEGMNNFPNMRSAIELIKNMGGRS